MEFTGKVIKYGDNVDTDVIIPARYLNTIDKKELLFISLSGIATGASWLFYYYAIAKGLVSVVVPIDKLSVVVTVAFSYFIFKEKLSKKALLGLILMIVGTLLMAFFK